MDELSRAFWFTRDAGKAGGAEGRLALLPEREEPSLGDW